MGRLPLLPKLPENLVFYREEPLQIKRGYQSKVMHVGAIYDILDKLKAVLEPYFDSKPEFNKERFSNDGKTAPESAENEPSRFPNTGYILKGTVKGVEHIVSLENIGCPIPFSMAQIHHAEIRVPQGTEDHLSSIVKQEFLKYETELKKSLE